LGCIPISNAPCVAEYVHLFDERNNKPYTIHMQASHELGKKNLPYFIYAREGPPTTTRLTKISGPVTLELLP
jgi:hypothetical protein